MCVLHQKAVLSNETDLIKGLSEQAEGIEQDEGMRPKPQQISATDMNM